MAVWVDLLEEGLSSRRRRKAWLKTRSNVEAR